MNFNQIDRESLISISPGVIVKYLQVHNWNLVDIPQHFQVIVLRKVFGSQEEEIAIPKTENFADYCERIFDAVRNISIYENRKIEEVLEDLLASAWDILRIRVTGVNVKHGSMSYLDENTVLDGFKKVLNASACYILDPKPFYPKLHRAEAEQWLKTCRSGLSEAGSYVIKIIFPHTASKRVANKENEIPFSRQVAEYLMSSLYSIKNYIHEPESPDLAREKLSANLCFALAEMKPNDNTNFGFSMSWSRDLPVSNGTPSEVVIYNENIDAITKMGQNLTPKKDATQDSFIGKILSLHGSQNDKGVVEGDVNFSLLVSEEPLKARGFLESDSYRKACDAHRDNKYIKITAILRTKPRCSDLDQISFFEALNK